MKTKYRLDFNKTHRNLFFFVGVYDPALIGDKPKWYSRNLTSIPFSVIEENSTLPEAMNHWNSKINDSEQTTSGKENDDEIENNSSCFFCSDGTSSDSEDENSGSDFASLNDFVSEMINSEICGEIRGKFKNQTKTSFCNFFNSVAKIYPENQEKTACVEYSTVYSPPDELQIPDGSNKISTSMISVNDSNQSMSESSISSSSNSLVNSRLNSPSEEGPDLSSLVQEIDSKSSSTTITPVAKCFPK